MALLNQPRITSNKAGGLIRCCQPPGARMVRTQIPFAGFHRATPAARREATNRPGSTSQGCLVLPNQPQKLDGSGRWPHLQLVGQLADLRRRVPAVPTKGLQER
jgi:hypothetical protein